MRSMFTFAQFWEYTNQRIRYNENIKYLRKLSDTTLKSHPPQQCELPKTPTFKPQISRQIEDRNVLRFDQYSSSAKLRLSKTKQRDYMESVSKWAHKKYKKWTTRNQNESSAEWSTDSSTYDSEDWETDSDYEDTMDKSNQSSQQGSFISPVEQQYNILHPTSSPINKKNSSTPLLGHGVVSETMKGPRFDRKISRNGKRLKRRAKWKGDEEKRLKVCISALMQMRFHDQLAYSGIHTVSSELQKLPSFSQ